MVVLPDSETSEATTCLDEVHAALVGGRCKASHVADDAPTQRHKGGIPVPFACTSSPRLGCCLRWLRHLRHARALRCDCILSINITRLALKFSCCVYTCHVGHVWDCRPAGLLCAAVHASCEHLCRGYMHTCLLRGLLQIASLARLPPCRGRTWPKAVNIMFHLCTNARRKTNEP